MEDRKAEVKANTSFSSLVGKLIREGNKSIKQDFEKLMQGGTLRMEIDEQIVYNQLNRKKNAIWSLLLASGYLKVETAEFVQETGQWFYTLALTNREVRIMFEGMVRDWFVEAEDNYNDFIKALLLNDIKAMNTYMNKVVLQMFSYFDAGKRPSGEEPERFYHGGVLGLMVELAEWSPMAWMPLLSNSRYRILTRRNFRTRWPQLWSR